MPTTLSALQQEWRTANKIGSYQWCAYHECAAELEPFIAQESAQAKQREADGHPLGYGGRVDAHSPTLDDGALSVSILISVDEPGEIRTRVWDVNDEERAQDMFDHCLGLWKLKNKYDSGWTS